MVNIPFFKNLKIPGFSLKSLSGAPSRIVGIDIGVSSTKVVQLKYDLGKVILETYGELQNETYLHDGSGSGGGFLRYLDSQLAGLLKDVLRESKVTSKEAVVAIPATSSFVAAIPFPKMSKQEIASAIPFEARKYIPVSLSEVALDWDVLEPEEEAPDKIEVLLVAVPKEMVEKIKRVAELAGVQLKGMEVETFSMTRSLVGKDQSPTAIINLGSQYTTIAMVDRGRLRISHNLSKGSQELNRALERGLGLSPEQAESIKRETGISERAEHKDIATVLTPLIDVMFSEIERMILLQNRRAARQIQKIILTGGGSSLKGLVNYVSSKFGLEVTRINPFNRIIAPPFLQPALQEIGPSFAVAVGLAMYQVDH